VANNGPIRPLVPTAIRTEFGDVLDDADFRTSQMEDLTWVPGHSDMRIRRDTELGEVVKGTRKASDVTILPVHMRWVRATKYSGAPDSKEVTQAGNDGYRPAAKEDIGKPWLTRMPAGASVTADGKIRKGDTELMICDGARAARNAAVKQMAVENMIRDPLPRAELAKLGVAADALSVERLPGREIKAPPSKV
jgi:hypothetical protein